MCLAPGETVSTTVDLSTAYPIDQTGLYHAGLKLRIHDIVGETGDSIDIPRPRAVHNALNLSCNEVEFRVVGDGKLSTS